MKAGFSEYSYAYAVTREMELVYGFLEAPRFLSTAEEGKPGGGYDLEVKLRGMRGLSLFVQYKVSDVMVRSNAKETRQTPLRVPLYRMHLLPHRDFNQHALLLTLERSGQHVGYVTSAFAGMGDFSRLYIARAMCQYSAFFRPETIGALPGGSSHHVSFVLGGPAYRYSEPVKLGENLTLEKALKDLKLGLSKQEAPPVLDDDYWGGLAGKMGDIVLSELGDRRSRSDVDLLALSDLTPLERASFLARVFFGCDLVIVAVPSA
jgi:hypothetical protein